MATQVATARRLFPEGRRAKDPWREQAFVRIAEQQFVLACLLGHMPGGIPEDAKQKFEDQWLAAATGARSSWGRGAVTRVMGQLDAVDTSLLRVAPDSYVRGQLPGILARVERFLPEGDVRLARIQALAQDPTCGALTECDRDLVVATSHAAANEERRGLSRLRSFTNMLYGAAIVLGLVALAFAIVGLVAPEALPVCFSPDGDVVCATAVKAADTANVATVDSTMRSIANPGDIALVEGLGLLAAALAAATSLRRLRGTSTPYKLPLAAALVKLPSGALTAILGLLLMRGAFVPGLSALDNPGQIVAWAVLLGYSQQLLTRMIDTRAQTILDNFGRSHAEQEKAHARVDTALAPA